MLQRVANLEEFELWEVFDDGVDKGHEAFAHPEGSRGGNDEDVVGYPCHAKAAEETEVEGSDTQAGRRTRWAREAYVLGWVGF